MIRGGGWYGRTCVRSWGARPCATHTGVNFVIDMPVCPPGADSCRAHTGAAAL